MTGKELIDALKGIDLSKEVYFRQGRKLLRVTIARDSAHGLPAIELTNPEQDYRRK